MSISKVKSDVSAHIELDSKTAAVFKRKKYEVTKEIGKGAFGKVYKARRLGDGSWAAVKVMDTALMKESFLEKFLPRELEMAMTLKHPHILNVFDIFKAAGKYYIFMEFASGGSLDKKVTLLPPPVKFAKKWFYQTTQALHYMHEEKTICHRDIKLENVLLDENGNARLSDFGFSRVHDGGLTKTICGTATYMSPQLIIRIDYDPFRADIWAMGVMLFGLLTAKHPFKMFPKIKTAKKEDWKKYVESMEKRQYKERPQYQELHPLAKNLIDGCLQPLEYERFDITKILKHKWFKVPPLIDV